MGVPLPGARVLLTGATGGIGAAIARRGEITVAPATMRVGAQIAGLAPGLAAWANRRLGGDRLALEFEERQAAKR